MPYIIPDKRDVLDPAISHIVNALRELECDYSTDDTAGNINYVVSQILSQVYTTRYSDINEAVGVLECIKQEFYRRVAAPYETQKAYENGDVYS